MGTLIGLLESVAGNTQDGRDVIGIRHVGSLQTEDGFDFIDGGRACRRDACGSARWALTVLWQVGDLDAVAPHECTGGNHPEKGSSERHIRFFDELDDNELRHAVYGHEQAKIALGGADFGQVDMEEANRIRIELLP